MTTSVYLETTEAHLGSIAVAALELSQQVKYVLSSSATEHSTQAAHSLLQTRWQFGLVVTRWPRST